MSPQYQILSKISTKIDGNSGTLVEVRFIPVINGVSDETKAEIQKYFVKDGEDIATILSRAAWNHEDEKKDQPVINKSPVPDPVIDAIPKNQL